MKKSSDPRHRNRRKIIKILFAQSFLIQKIKDKKVMDIVKNIQNIDSAIEKIAPEFPIKKIKDKVEG